MFAECLSVCQPQGRRWERKRKEGDTNDEEKLTGRGNGRGNKEEGREGRPER